MTLSPPNQAPCPIPLHVTIIRLTSSESHYVITIKQSPRARRRHRHHHHTRPRLRPAPRPCYIYWNVTNKISWPPALKRIHVRIQQPRTEPLKKRLDSICEFNDLLVSGLSFAIYWKMEQMCTRSATTFLDRNTCGINDLLSRNICLLFLSETDFFIFHVWNRCCKTFF